MSAETTTEPQRMSFLIIKIVKVKEKGHWKRAKIKIFLF